MTKLTIQQVIREIEISRSSVENQFVALEKLQEEKFKNIVEIINRLQALHEEKFNSLTIQLNEKDEALKAEKQSIEVQNQMNAATFTKSEGNFTKQIDQIASLIQVAMNATNSKIDNIVQRITQIESQSQGKQFTSEKMTSLISQVMTGIVSLIIMIGAIISIVLFVLHH